MPDWPETIAAVASSPLDQQAAMSPAERIVGSVEGYVGGCVTVNVVAPLRPMLPAASRCSACAV